MAKTITLNVGMSLAEAEKLLIEATLEMFDWEKRRTAHALGVSLKTVYNKVNEYGITAPAHVYRRYA